jgi:hypothetical protein
MARLRVMSRQGDTAVTWDPAAVRAGDPTAIAAVEEAERILNEERKKGGTAFAGQPGEPRVVIERFDPEVEEIIIVPRVIGG